MYVSRFTCLTQFISNGKDLDIQDIVGKLAAKIEKYQVGRTEKGRSKYK